MAIRVRYKVEVAVSSTTAEEKDLGNQKYEVVSDVQGEGGSWKTTLPAGAVDVQLNLGNVASAKLLIVRTTSKDPTYSPAPVTLKRNDAATGEPFVVQPLSDAKEGIFAITTDALTALFASNPGSVVMDVTVVACGD